MVRSFLRESTRNDHATLWTNHEECRQAKLALPSPSARLAKTLLRLSRPRMRLVTAALTGHGFFNKHLYVLGVTDSPLCRACLEAEETAAHVLMECTGVADYRAKHLGQSRDLPGIVGNVKGLLAFLEELGWLE